tara:strand:+ start:179 stop:1357 length:1179 start_codon:yes stop_codon:yes gene_type:complete
MESKVEEVPGLYGGVRVEENVIQRIWYQSGFITHNLVSEEGKKLSILNTGTWNRSEEGPDFRNAVIWIGGEKKFGDVEIHFFERDWKNHGHDRDPNYNQVILHVCLFPRSCSANRTKNSLGKEIPQLSLLPFLYQGIEEYNEEWILAALSGRDQNLHSLAIGKPKNVEDEMLKSSHLRWVQKKNYAKKRIDQMGWEQACHQWFLEVLGYPRNKQSMHEVATLYSLEDWRVGLDVQRVYQQMTSWKKKGMRPANQPINRLNQYQQIVAKVPHWPDELKAIHFPESSNPLEENRAKLGIYSLRKKWRDQVLSGVLGSSKADTLLIDSGLPLWAALHEFDCFSLWYHWPSGDFSNDFRELAVEWGLKQKGKSLSNGVLQGLFQNFLLDQSKNSKQ